MRFFIFAILSFAMYHICFAGVVYVPGDETTIQAGINVANEGDTVLVAAGTYTGEGNRDIDFGGKSLVLKSEEGPDLTIINAGDEWHRGFNFHSGEDTTAIVEGFIITGGHGQYGAGIACIGASPILRGNIIIGNHAGNDWGYSGDAGNGGGIYLSNSHAQIISNQIIENISCGYFGGVGGGIFALNSDPVICDNVIMNNFTCAGDMGNSSGAGIYMKGCTGLISGNSFLGNLSASQSGGTFYCGGLRLDGSQPIIERCLFAYNGGWPCWSYGMEYPAIISCCISFGHQSSDDLPGVNFATDTLGNLCIDPEFCDTIDYYLYPHSPCLPNNNECSVLIGANTVGDCNYRVMINIDRSGSMGITNPMGLSRFERARQLAHDDIDKVISEDDPEYPGVHEMAVMCFNTTGGIEMIQDFTTDSIMLHDAIDAIQNPRHDTPLAAAMCQAHCNLNDLDSILGYVFTYTDGKENNSEQFEICSICELCNYLMSTGWNYDCDPDNPETCTDWQMCLYSLFIENNVNVIHYFGEPVDPNVKSGDLADFYFLNSAANNSNGLFYYHSDFEIPEYLCGDANHDGNVNVSDAVYVINYIFEGGDQPTPYGSGDVNCDLIVNVSDAVYIINHVFIGGNSPCDINGDGNPDC